MPCEFNKGRAQASCQFHMPEDQLIKNSNRTLCIFHAPYDWTLPSGTKKHHLSPKEKDHFFSFIYHLINESRELGSALNLRGVYFPDGIEFNDAAFDQVFFDGAKFGGAVSFEQSTFDGVASFQGVDFNGGASFSKAIFNKDVIFSHASIRLKAIFSRAEFKGGAHFERSSLTDAQFEFAHFYGEGEYCGADVTSAYFEHIIAESDMDFTDTRFSGDAIFIDALFKGSVDYSSTGKNKEEPRYFLPVTLFEGATFQEDVTFNNRRFTDTTSFYNARFIRAPSFHNCDLHEDTIFEGAEFKDVSDTSASAYRTLKHQMENVRARREEGTFYALEQRCLRNNMNIPISVRIFSWLYDATSVYGQSVGRPLILLGVIFLLFSLVYALTGHVCCDFSSSIDWHVTGHMFGLSMEQMVNPFWIWRIEELPDGLNERLLLIKFLGTLQSVMSLAFLALFFLALRWRFKRG